MAGRSTSERRFADLYNAHRSPVWLYCRRRVGVDRADDVMGDVFLTVWRRIEETPEPTDALPWLYRIAYLTISNHWRSIARKNNLDAKLHSLGVSPPTPIADHVAMREEVRTVVNLLHGLNPPDAEVLRLVAWEQLNTGQIASVLDISPAAAKQRLSRARKRLSKQFQRKYGTHDPSLLEKEVSGEL